ncbi:phosphate ABC transporter permease PstA [Symbiobacterium thermophilum]|uniref:Phosphate transport system permease protein PstA n=2 Tax=Symbiobacterium thermophilum TaxID=2734 RepID=Q67SX1_SYMTH|nr:phosphate ABC transporter permease PstA [Symbiobacterium thermophilum]MBY6275209.1 phosphate ABC transporter, permease protein PstA [Symbiobacterium thermophilum]BAD39222.1 phosphate ABC transporter permease protein [Symbiobacterium thermophilum IAM 14863]
MRPLLSALALAVTGVMVGLLAALAAGGAGSLTPEFLFTLPAAAGREGGILPAILSTLWLAAGSLALALPLGVGTALYLAEYAPPGRWVAAIRSLTETLAGVPSILFGLFGFSVFVVRLGWGPSLLAGSATLALMLLPTVIRTSEEAVAAVPQELREGAAALGATRWDAVRRIVLPQAAPGILTGALLALGRAAGETAAVLLTAGTDLALPRSPLDPGRSMAVHLYLLAGEGLSDGRAHATALALVCGVMVLNALAQLLMGGRRDR